MKRSLLVVLLSALMVVALGVGAAFAGEVTGSGKNSEQNQGKSWCSFSGLNDEPDRPLDGFNPGGKSQSYGQENRLGLVDPVEDKFVHPGTFCNPNKSPLGDNPNRDV